MVKKCCLLSCKSGPEPERTLFRFPTNRVKCSTWFDAVNPDLPEEFTVDSLKNRYICDLHFPSFMYGTSGNRKRLFFNACPIKLTERPPKIPEIPVIPVDSNKRSVATQVHFATKEREIISLKKKITSLVAKMEKLKSDPPASLVYKNRHKLAQYVTDEAWLLFDCAVTNQQKGIHGHRHSMEVKKLTQSIAQKNRATFKMLKPIFSLPSLRTLGRMEPDLDTPAKPMNNNINTYVNIHHNHTNNNINNLQNINHNTTINTTINGNHNLIQDKSHRDESSSIDNFQMDATSHMENINIEDLHLGNITFVSVPFAL